MSDAPLDLREVGYRLDEVDRDLGRLEIAISTRADGAAMVREIESIRAEIREARAHVMGELRAMRDATDSAVQRTDRTANDVIRAGRAESLKLIIAAMTAFAVLLGGVVALYASGRI